MMVAWVSDILVMVIKGLSLWFKSGSKSRRSGTNWGETWNYLAGTERTSQVIALLINNWESSHAVPYFVSSSFLPLDLLYFKSVGILMHDISNSLTPTNVSNLFASQSNTHSYNTRPSSRGDYYVKHSRLDKQTKSFSRYGVKIWNSLPCEMRQISTTLNSEYFQKKMIILIYPT